MKCQDFEPRDDPRFKKTCRKCGRPKDLHQRVDQQFIDPQEVPLDAVPSDIADQALEDVVKNTPLISHQEESEPADSYDSAEEIPPLVDQALELEAFDPIDYLRVRVSSSTAVPAPMDTRISGVTNPAVNPKEVEAMSRSDKPPLSLLEHVANVDTALAMAEGARKYGRGNYRKIGSIKATIYIDAIERHIGAWKTGEDIDVDSGLNHLAKIAASVHVLYGAIDAGTFEDDR